MRNSISRKRLIIAFVLYLAVRICISVFPKVATTYADELLYLELAQNIWRKGVLSLFCVPVRFSKILYPLTLSPFYAITDPIARTTAISVFNAVLVSSALIPGWLIAARMIPDRKKQLAAMVFLACMADMNFSVTLMAENLYLPLLLWGIYFLIRDLDAQGGMRIGTAALSGFWCFLLYTAKESGAAFLAAASVLQLRRIVIRKGQRKQWIQAGAVFAAAFLIPFLLLRLTVFAGVPYSYSVQVSESGLGSPDRWAYMLRVTVSLLLFFMLSVLFFPVLTGLKNGRAEKTRPLAIFTGLYAVLTALGIAFAICLPEEYGRGDLRIHLRYFMGVAFPVIVLYLSGEDRERTTWRARLRSPRTAGALLFGVAVLLLHMPVRTGSLVDAPSLEALVQLLPAESVTPDMVLLAASVALLAVWIIWGERIFTVCLAVVLLAGQVLNGAFFVARARKVERPAAAAEAVRLDRFMDQLDGNILVVKQGLYMTEERTLDTYSNDDYYAIETEDLTALAWAQKQPGWIDLRNTGLKSVYWAFTAADTYTVDRIDYIVTEDPGLIPTESGNENITPDGLGAWRVYRAKDPEMIRIFDRKPYQMGERISFQAETESFSRYARIGFSTAESGFTWTNGKYADMILNLEEAAPEEMTVTMGVAMTIGPQRVAIRMNGITAWEGVVEGGGEVVFAVPREAVTADPDRIRIEMDLPDATLPGNGDPRQLALAVQYIVLDGAPGT